LKFIYEIVIKYDNKLFLHWSLSIKVCIYSLEYTYLLKIFNII